MRNIYICERSCLKGALLGQGQLAKIAMATYQKTLTEIRKGIVAANEAMPGDAESIITTEEKLGLIDQKLKEISAKINAESSDHQ